jgi:hypothetical protein
LPKLTCQPKYETENKVEKVGVFFRPEKVSVNSPRFTSNPPQLHHKITTLKTAFSQKPLQKRPPHHAAKKA